ncbi:MAG TPA: hypothetical protein VGO62_04260 [Myxococcota bacterium]|jgi:hypothetical protein
MRAAFASLATVVTVVTVATLAGCALPEKQSWPNTFSGAGDDAFLTDDDFVCLADPRWSQVSDDFYWGSIGHGDDVVALAKSKQPGTYPVGTVVSLMPGEAMVKRGEGFSSDTNDWEFLQFDLDSGRTIITNRGTTEVANIGGTCISCHAPAKDFDLVCNTNSKCPQLPFFINTHIVPKNDDHRCASAH